MDKKKALERLSLEEAAAIYPDFPSGNVIETERPDFLISSDSRVTGIEVVNYVRGQGAGGSADRRNEILQQKVVDRGRREFESNHLEPLMVHFSWDLNRYPRKTDVPFIATSAAEVVEQYIPQTLFGHTRISSDRFSNTLLCTFVSSINAMRVRNDRQALWSSISAGFVSVSEDELQRLLASKATKAQGYLQDCDEMWLLIVADGRYMSSTAELLQEEARVSQLQTAFQRVLFYDRWDKQVTSLTG